MKTGFQNWVDDVTKSLKPADIKPGEVIKSSAGEPFGAVTFVKVPKHNFLAEVAKKGDYYIYHFFPTEKWLGRIASFYYPMMDGFTQLFKDHGEVEHEWVEEMTSFAVRVNGWANHVWGDELALRVLDVVDANLEEQEAQYDTKPISK